MSVFSKFLAVTAVSAGLAVAAAAPAQAAVINLALGAPAGPYSLGNPSGAIVPNFPLGFSVPKNNTFNFTFDVSPGSYRLLAFISELGAPGIGLLSGPHPAAFQLFSGTPTGTNSLISTSGLVLNSTLLTNISGGSYFLRIRPTDIFGNDQLVVGGIRLSAVPEPVTWTMMITGFGMLGLAARRRRRLAFAAT